MAMLNNQMVIYSNIIYINTSQMHFPFIGGNNIGAPLSNTCSKHTKQPSFRSRPPVPSPERQSLWVNRPWMMKVIISMSRCGWVPHGASNVNYGLLWVTSFKHQTLENLLESWMWKMWKPGLAAYMDFLFSLNYSGFELFGSFFEHPPGRIWHFLGTIMEHRLAIDSRNATWASKIGWPMGIEEGIPMVHMKIAGSSQCWIPPKQW